MGRKMLNKQAWTKWVLITALVALATFAPTSFAFADEAGRGEALTILADHAPCGLAWVNNTSGVSAEVYDEICYAFDRETASATAVAAAAHVPHKLSWASVSSDIPSAVLDEIAFKSTFEVTQRAFAETSGDSGQTYWEFVLEQNYHISP
jgi:hypothetical protein